MRRKLADDLVAEVRRLWGEGVSSPELGRRFKISTSYAWHLCELMGGPELRAARAASLAAAALGRKTVAEEARRKEAGNAARRKARKASSVARRDEEVRRLWAEGWMGKDIAARFKIARSKVSAIVAGMPRAPRYAGDEDDAPPAVLPRGAGPSAGSGPSFAPSVPLDPADRLTGLGPWGRAEVRGSQHGRAILDEPGVAEMRRLRREGWSTGRLARRFGVSRNTAAYALNGTTWGHVPGAIKAKGAMA